MRSSRWSTQLTIPRAPCTILSKAGTLLLGETTGWIEATTILLVSLHHTGRRGDFTERRDDQREQVTQPDGASMSLYRTMRALPRAIWSPSRSRTSLSRAFASSYRVLR